MFLLKHLVKHYIKLFETRHHVNINSDVTCNALIASCKLHICTQAFHHYKSRSDIVGASLYNTAQILPSLPLLRIKAVENPQEASANDEDQINKVMIITGR
jgi:hypothetical protein